MSCREDGKLLIRNSSRDDAGAEPMAVSEILGRRKWTGGLTLSCFERMRKLPRGINTTLNWLVRGLIVSTRTSSPLMYREACRAYIVCIYIHMYIFRKALMLARYTLLHFDIQSLQNDIYNGICIIPSLLEEFY